MAREVFDQDPYTELRQGARDILFRAGIPSNPGSIDLEIVNGARRIANLAPIEPWDEWSKQDGKFEGCRDRLIETILEAGVDLQEPITETTNILKGLEILTSRR
ncbi:hypothetical protein CMO96_03120 [Candidatus Woesebacteria bacterium]|nr:hypothetical protein [Candidatus Woesebacteria bacterium]|tara:strand:+ start:305 stop:616 length:312 start_codon:yes stop_codon:yes gene_type:complete